MVIPCTWFMKTNLSLPLRSFVGSSPSEKIVVLIFVLLITQLFLLRFYLLYLFLYKTYCLGLPIFELHINRLMLYSATFLKNQHYVLGFIHVLACICSTFVSLLYILVLNDQLQFKFYYIINNPINLDYVQIFAKWCYYEYSCMGLLVHMCGSFFQVYSQERRCGILQLMNLSVYQKMPNYFPKWLESFLPEIFAI